MPRKKTGMPFEVHPSPKKAENGEQLLYVKPESGRVRSLDDFETWFGDKFSLRKGDMTRVFDAFFDGAPEWFAKGYRIETPIGIFMPKIRLKRQETNPDSITHDDVELEGIDFLPTKSFIKKLKHEIGSNGFRYVRKPQSGRLIHNLEHLEKALYQSIRANNGYTTVASLMYYSGLSKYSASKALAHWCYGENPKLKCSRYGHSDFYTPT